MRDIVATVEANQILSPVYGRLKLQLGVPLEFRPGHFVMVRPQGIYEPILRRALAVYQQETVGELTSIELIYQVFGRGLDQLRRVRPGDGVDCLGPLGTPFPVPGGSGQRTLLVAGGVGSASLYLLAQELQRQQQQVNLFFGAATKAALIGLEDFEALGVEITVTTNDGSAGVPGLVTEAVESYLQRPQEQSPILYTCGPFGMMRRVAQIAAAHSLRAYVSLETRMACGFGVCVGCVHPIRGAGESFTYQRVCVEGPVFESSQVVWETEG